MSVKFTPSTANVPEVALEPCEINTDCWPDSDPATLTRSTCTPGTDCNTTQGSRAVGMLDSSCCETCAPVPTRLVSSIGASPVTVTVAATADNFIGIDSSVLRPICTTTFSRFTVENPWSDTVNV